MKIVAKRCFALGVLFLLAPVWTFPFIDEIALWLIERKGQYRGILDFDNQRFQTEYMTYHCLYIIGVWITIPAILVLSCLKIKETLETRSVRRSG